MRSYRKFITEPGDRRWLEATQWSAAAGGILVLLLFGAMALLPPGERAAVETERAAQSSVSDTPVATGQPASSEMPGSTLPPIATDAESFAAPEKQVPTF